MKLYVLRNNLIHEGKEDPQCFNSPKLAKVKLGKENLENKIMESFGLTQLFEQGEADL